MYRAGDSHHTVRPTRQQPSAGSDPGPLYEPLGKCRNGYFQHADHKPDNQASRKASVGATVQNRPTVNTSMLPTIAA
jgi:hypothetical protein